VLQSPTRPAPLPEDQIQQVLAAIANGFRTQLRSPILRTPAEADLVFEDVTFPSEDGVPLEAWFIPRPGSDELIIVNHPRWFSRSGLPSHLEPWKSLGGAAGNDFEVNFIPDFRALHDAGYNVLAYDLRNFGHSGVGNGGIGTGGRFESRDVIGALAYVRSRPDLSGMTIGLFSRCLGCNATLFAMARRPETFADVRCLVGVQPLSVRVIMERMLELRGVPVARIDELDTAVRLATSFSLDDMSPITAAASVTTPTLLYQVRDDLMTRASDVQAIFDSLGAAEKDLFWIDGTTRRWDGYTYFARRPEKVLAWFARHMG